MFQARNSKCKEPVHLESHGQGKVADEVKEVTWSHGKAVLAFVKREGLQDNVKTTVWVTNKFLKDWVAARVEIDVEGRRLTRNHLGGH
jgi:hypothetical protein